MVSLAIMSATGVAIAVTTQQSSTIVCSFVDTPHNLDLSLLLHLRDIPICHEFHIVIAVLETSAPARPSTICKAISWDIAGYII